MTKCFILFYYSLIMAFKQFFEEPKLALLGIFLRSLNAFGPFLIWLLFFFIENKIAENNMEKISLIMGFACTVIGIQNCLFNGLHYLSFLIKENSTFKFLLNPQPSWFTMSTSNFDLNGIGYIFSGLFFIFYSKLSILQFLISMILIFFITIFYLGYLTFLNSTSFFRNSFSKIGLYLDSMIITFTQFPENFFSPSIKWILYTFIPAGFLAYWPSSIIIQLNIIDLFKFSFFSSLVFIFSLLFFKYGIYYHAKNQ